MVVRLLGKTVKNQFSYLSTETYVVVGTQKNGLTETAFLITQNTC